jgi:AcrR family transcriptional regulator
LAAAARLFRLRGFEEVTVTEVSRSSGGVLT